MVVKWLDIWKKDSRKRFIRKYDKIIIHEQSKKVKEITKDIKNSLQEFEKSKTRYYIKKAMNNIILKTTRSGSRYHKIKINYKISEYDAECLNKFRNVMKSIQTRLKKKIGIDSNIRIFINYKKDDGTKGIYSTTFFKMNDYKIQIDDIIDKFCNFYEMAF